MKVILFDAHSRSSLSALRSLYKRDIDVICASNYKSAISFYSRFCKEKLVYPDPAKDRRAFCVFVESFIKKSCGEFLFMSFSDVVTDALYFGKKAGMFDGEMVGPSVENYEKAVDKKNLSGIAHSLGIPIPKDLAVSKESALSQAHSFAYPIIIKPRHSASWIGDAAYKATASVIFDEKTFTKKFLELLENTKETPLVQEMIVGEEFGVSVIADHGVIKSLFAHRRLRSISRFGGASALRESVATTDEMKEIAQKLCSALEWHGVMMIELKRDSFTGALVLIEINARFWGSLFLSIKSGVDFPYLLCLLKDGAVSDYGTEHYNTGIKARHFISDLSYHYSLRGGVLRYKHLKNLFGFLQKNLYHDVWSFTDPLPWFVELFQFLKKKL